MLEALLASSCVRDLKMALRTLIPGAKLSASRKAGLMNEILRLAGKDAVLHGEACRYLLATTTKSHIDMMIRCLGSRHAKQRLNQLLPSYAKTLLLDGMGALIVGLLRSKMMELQNSSLFPTLRLMRWLINNRLW